jgi:hypothetical protein
MRRIAVIGLGLLACTATARAGVPAEFNIQGVLRDNAGQLQSMPVNVIASFFDAVTGGNLVAGPYGTINVPVTNGLFSVVLPAADLVSKLAAEGQVFLELAIGGDTFPRQPVAPDIYALMCSKADSLSAACSGCISDSMIAALSAGKLTGTLSGSATVPAATVSGALSNATISGANVTGALSGSVTVPAAGVIGMPLVVSGYLPGLQTPGVGGAVSKIAITVPAAGSLFVTAQFSVLMNNLMISFYPECNMEFQLGPTIRAPNPLAAGYQQLTIPSTIQTGAATGLSLVFPMLVEVVVPVTGAGTK